MTEFGRYCNPPTSPAACLDRASTSSVLAETLTRTVLSCGSIFTLSSTACGIPAPETNPLICSYCAESAVALDRASSGVGNPTAATTAKPWDTSSETLASRAPSTGGWAMPSGIFPTSQICCLSTRATSSLRLPSTADLACSPPARTACTASTHPDPTATTVSSSTTNAVWLPSVIVNVRRPFFSSIVQGSLP